jgi:ribosomal protein S18 acetylase RimI-like enzyme
MSTEALIGRHHQASMNSSRPCDIRIEPFTRDFYEAYVNIHAEILPVQYPKGWYDSFFTNDSRVGLVALDMSLPAESRVVGFCTGRVELKERGCLECIFKCGDKVMMHGYVMSLGCRKSHRRQGIASRMLGVLLEELISRGAERLYLHCTTVNKGAVALYRKHGFEVVEKLLEYYHFHGKYHDAFKLSKKIPPNQANDRKRRHHAA